MFITRAACDPIRSSSWTVCLHCQSSIVYCMSISQNTLTEDECICLTLCVDIMKYPIACIVQEYFVYDRKTYRPFPSGRRGVLLVSSTPRDARNLCSHTVCVKKSAFFKVQMLTQDAVHLKSEFTCTLNPLRASFNCVQMYVGFGRRKKVYVCVCEVSWYQNMT